jgi:hypothetical protein
MIQKEGKKPLVFRNGEVVEGGDDYTPEEIEEIRKNSKIEFSGTPGTNLGEKQFDFRSNEGLENFKKQMEEMKSSFGGSSKDMDQTKEEMLKAKEEMIKAKEELEKARKELEKSKTATKTKKA